MDPSSKKKLEFLKKNKLSKIVIIDDDDDDDSLEKTQHVNVTKQNIKTKGVTFKDDIISKATKNTKGTNIESDKRDKIQKKNVTIRVVSDSVPAAAASGAGGDDITEQKPVKAQTIGVDATKTAIKTDVLLGDIDKIQFEKKELQYIYNTGLNTNFDDLNTIKLNEKVFICPYRINTFGLKPFLEFCFYKYPDNIKDFANVLVFPNIKYTQKKSVIQEGSDLVKYLFKNDSTPQFFIRNRPNETYVFYEITDFEHAIRQSTKKTQWWWAMVSEIVNYKKIMNFDIHHKIYDLFIKNPSLIYLKDFEGNIIEIPEVGFHGTYYNLMDLITSYGLRPSTLYSMMGPYYYFGTFRKAVRYAGWTSTYKERVVDGVQIADDSGLYNRGGIIRFALFLGDMKVNMNHPNDEDDYSDLVKQRIRENPRIKEYEELTIKIHDHNGKWAEKYDSIYVGKAQLENGGLFMKNPEFVVKHLDQQLILTTHELDKKTLQKDKRTGKYKWQPFYENYNII